MWRKVVLIFHTHAPHVCQSILNHVTCFKVRIVYIEIDGNIKLFITSASHLMLVYLDFLSGFLNTKSLYTMAGVRRKTIYCSGISQ